MLPRARWSIENGRVTQVKRPSRVPSPRRRVVPACPRAGSAEPTAYGKELRKWIQIGASPRGTIGLDKCSRTYAWMQGRDYVRPDDVQAIVHDVLRHRILLSYDAQAEGIKANEVIDKIIQLVAVG